VYRWNAAVIEDAVRHIRACTDLRPTVAVVLGSGLGGFADELTEGVDIPYPQIPGWPCSTAVGHAGTLILGRLDRMPLAVMAGRAHLYEGYTPAQVTHGVRVLGLLGVRSILFTNAAGAINTGLAPGRLVLIADHINLQGSNPLVGPNDERFGPRFPDMSEVYCESYREVARQAAAELGIVLTEGVYAAMLGPSYETPAEIRFLRAIGADLVGMSTVPEAIVANQMGIKVLGISCVTNMAAGVLERKITHQEVLETGAMVRDTLVRLLKRVLPRLEAA
jgi:purine-nucleoside phosphorylase